MGGRYLGQITFQEDLEDPEQEKRYVWWTIEV